MNTIIHVRVLYYDAGICVLSVRFRPDEPTCQDSTGDPWDALNLSHIVGCEVFITGSVEER